MAFASANYKTHHYSKAAPHGKSFFAGRGHYTAICKESNSPRKGHEGEHRACILSHEWLARHDVPYTATKSSHSMDVDDSYRAYDSSFDHDDDFADLDITYVLQTARRKKNLDNHTSWKKNWDTILPYIIKAIHGKTIANTHTKECSPLPHEILFVDCTCKEIALI